MPPEIWLLNTEVPLEPTREGHKLLDISSKFQPKLSNLEQEVLM